MRTLHVSRNLCRLIIFCTAFGALATVPLRSRAQPSTSVVIVNASTREIRHIYLSHVGADDWTGNQLGDSVIPPGQLFTLSGLACDQQQVKVIGEDQDGCFLSTIFDCASITTWP